MYDDVLVPTDGSETVAATLDHALPVAADNDATVHALYVIDSRITMAADPEDQGGIEATLRQEGEEAVGSVAEAAEAEGLETVQTIRQGTPHKEILDYVGEAGVDLVAVGSHGKSPREKIESLGSVSERVVDNADVPVLVVRDE